MTWVKLPTGEVINTDLIQFLKIQRLGSPREQFAVYAYVEGHPVPIAQELYQVEAAEKVLDAFLFVAHIKPVVLDPDLRGFKRKVASIPPELQGED